MEAADEVQALVEEVVIPESWFFRDDRPFEVLDRLRPVEGWAGEPGRSPLTASASLPCAGGEEPYSIAIDAPRNSGLRGRPVPGRRGGRERPERWPGRSPGSTAGQRLPRGGPRPPTVGPLPPSVTGRSSSSRTCGRPSDSTWATSSTPPCSTDRLAVRRGLLSEPVDLSRRRSRGSRAFATLARLVADDGLLFLGHADRLDAGRSHPLRSRPTTGGPSPIGRSRPRPRSSTHARRTLRGPKTAPSRVVVEAPAPPIAGQGRIDPNRTGSSPKPGRPGETDPGRVDPDPSRSSTSTGPRPAWPTSRRL